MWFITCMSCILIATSCCLAFTLLFANFYRVTTLVHTLMHNYNHYLYHVVFIHVLTLNIIKLCNCSPDYMYIIMYYGHMGFGILVKINLVWSFIITGNQCWVILQEFPNSIKNFFHRQPMRITFFL